MTFYTVLAAVKTAIDLSGANLALLALVAVCFIGVFKSVFSK